MISEFELDIRMAFVVKPDTIMKIHNLLMDRIGKIEYKAECSDNVTRKFETIDELLKYENAVRKQINNLRMNSEACAGNESARIEFCHKWYFKGTRVKITGEEGSVTGLRSGIMDILSGTRPWYWFILKLDIFVATFILLFIAWIAFLYNEWRSLVEWRNLVESESVGVLLPMSAVFLGVLGFCALYYGAAYLLYRIRKMLFPYGSFIIGQGQDRFETLEKWRWGFFIAILTSLIAGVIILLLT